MEKFDNQVGLKLKLCILTDAKKCYYQIKTLWLSFSLEVNWKEISFINNLWTIDKRVGWISRKKGPNKRVGWKKFK